MKKLRELQGGYPRQQDYLLNLQNELFAVTDGLFGKLNHDMVLQGCEVVDNGNGTVNIPAGIVYVGGEALRFDGANNVLANGDKTFVKQTATTTDPKVFGDGATKDVYSEVKVIIGDKTSATEIAIKTTLYTLETYISDVVANYAIKGEIKDIYDIDGDFLTNFDEDGLGVTPRYVNWRLFNGNGGLPDAQGRTRITAGTVLDPGTGLNVTFSHGQMSGEVGHKLTVNEMPAHDHFIANSSEIPGSTNQPLSGSGIYRFLAKLWDAGGVKGYSLNGSSTTPNIGKTSSVGSGLAHNNMQPYITVYTIIRVA